ncbi:hypothetical protein DWY02_10010 [Eubacterium sp. AF22-9]|nr:hypothetical protein DWY02_10010 [Eubacterium sp. AF22-9]
MSPNTYGLITSSLIQYDPIITSIIRSSKTKPTATEDFKNKFAFADVPLYCTSAFINDLTSLISLFPTIKARKSEIKSTTDTAIAAIVIFSEPFHTYNTNAANARIRQRTPKKLYVTRFFVIVYRAAVLSF